MRATGGKMPSSAWKGYISFGLISVPIRLYPAARYFHLSFREIHRKCGTRVHQQLYCPYDREIVSRDDIAMGYEVDKDKYVLVDLEELKRLQSASSTAMEIVQFVNLAEVDPIYFETSYFSVPEESGVRAYALLLKVMQEKNYAAIAQVTMHQKERTVIIRPYRGGLILHTIYYPNEIREAKDYGKAATANLKRQEVGLAAQFARALLKPFHLEQFHDEYTKRVERLIESKNHGMPAPKPENVRRLAPVVDLMSALKKSLAGRESDGNAHKSKRLKKSA
jgi:DNA end-binding protein Ku